MSNDYIIERKRIGKYEIQIRYDMDAGSYMDPAEEFAPFEILYTSTRYNLGTRRMDSEELSEYAKEIVEGGGLVLPVFAHIHGSVSMSTGRFGDPWDSGQSGVIVLPKEDWDEYFPDYEKERLYETMSATVDTYGKWADGEVYEWVIVDLPTGDIVDSCCGFFGQEHAMEDAEVTAARLVRRDEGTKESFKEGTLSTSKARYILTEDSVRVISYTEDGEKTTKYKLKEGVDILSFLKDNNLERVSHG